MTMIAMDSSEVEPVISDQAQRKLRLAHTPTCVRDGWRTVSRASYQASVYSDSVVEVPEEMYSVETVEFLGFAAEVAWEIWKRYREQEKLQPDEVELLEVCNDRVDQGMDACDDTDDWDAAMQSMGITAQLRARILTPGHENIRATQSAKEWVLATIKERYGFLFSLNTWILHPNLSRALPVTRPPATKTAERWANRDGRPPRHPSMHDRALMLYKGGTMALLAHAQPGGHARLERIASRGTLDYSHAPAKPLYLTPQLGAATAFASYARARCGAEVPVGVLQVAVPKALLRVGRPISLSLFQDLAWCHRVYKTGTDGIAAAAASAGAHPLLVGPVLAISNATLHRLVRDGGVGRRKEMEEEEEEGG
ncbi:MAG: hypothetical protein M1838_001359 [Thelocarpon superellum]|nr:MAG: hypothetical protein M1838_001359 [Thelocarpon superellum]